MFVICTHHHYHRVPIYYYLNTDITSISIPL